MEADAEANSACVARSGVFVVVRMLPSLMVICSDFPSRKVQTHTRPPRWSLRWQQPMETLHANVI